MTAIIDILSLPKCLPCGNDKEAWTAIIPAAGRGTRLDWGKPKILFPILNRPILYWLLDILLPVTSKIVLVVSPEGENSIRESINKESLTDFIDICIQDEPTGMGDAVLLSEPLIKTANSLIVWGDQIMLTGHTIMACQYVHTSMDGIKLTLPTVMKELPYINFVRDDCGRITLVQQAREGEVSVLVGENDCGLFLFDTSALFEGLKRAKKLGHGGGVVTKEFNLLQAIPIFQKNDLDVKTLRIHDQSQCMGINTLADARLAEELLIKRNQ